MLLFQLKVVTNLALKKIKSDLVTLLKVTKPIVKYRNKFVGHKNARKITIKATMKDLYTAIDLIEKLVIKYQLLLNQAGMTSLLPGNSNPDLTAIFK